jgi:hypothetical protein
MRPYFQSSGQGGSGSVSLSKQTDLAVPGIFHKIFGCPHRHIFDELVFIIASKRL